MFLLVLAYPLRIVSLISHVYHALFFDFNLFENLNKAIVLGAHLHVELHEKGTSRITL